MALSLFLAATHGSHHDLGPCPTDVGPMQHFDPVLVRKGLVFDGTRRKIFSKSASVSDNHCVHTEKYF